MKTENIYCDYCGKRTTEDNIKKEQVNGFSIKAGYSIGGWGRYNDFMTEQSVEICDECFKKVRDKILELRTLIKQLQK